VFESGSNRPHWETFVLAPFDYLRWLIERIDREARNAIAGKPAGIVAKLNSLVDPRVIQALYNASAAGVQIDLVIRSMCCLVPGLPGVSENIRVISIVDRFLEHSRIVQFLNEGSPEVFLSSGDWMPRNFDRRVELTFPIVDRALRDAILQILQITLGDTAASWELRADGSWQPRGLPNGFSSQQSFIDITRAESFSFEALHVSDYSSSPSLRRMRGESSHSNTAVPSPRTRTP